MYEYRCVSTRRQRDGPALLFIWNREWTRGLPLWEPAGTAGPHEHCAVSLPDDVHRPTTILAFLDASKTYEVCKVRRVSRDIPIVSRCDGADGSSGIPCLVVA